MHKMVRTLSDQSSSCNHSKKREGRSSSLSRLTSHRALNSLCSMRSSSLTSRVTMVACRGVLSKMDSPNAVPMPRVQIVTASFGRRREGQIERETERQRYGQNWGQREGEEEEEDEEEEDEEGDDDEDKFNQVTFTQFKMCLRKWIL